MHNLFISLLFISCLLALPDLSKADFYKYKDDSGSINITNEYESIPKKYRSKVKVVKESDLENRVKSKKELSASQSQQQEQGVSEADLKGGDTKQISIDKSNSDSWIGRQFPLLKVIAIIILSLSLIIFAGKFLSQLLPGYIATVIKIALFAAVALYLFKTNAAKVSEAFTNIKSGADVAQKAVDKRSEKIEKQAQ